MKKLLLFVCLASLTSNAWAGFFSGNELYEKCSVKKSEAGFSLRDTFCHAYVAGVVDSLAGPSR